MLDTTKFPNSDADDLCLLTSAELAQAYADRSLSPVEVTRAALNRARDIDTQLNAFTFIDEEGALEMAYASEARWHANRPVSSCDGVPATIKDIVHARGWSMRFGSRLTPPGLCDGDAPAVARMRAAGLVFLGATTTPEFGWKALTDSPASGITRNPWNPDLTPGGSSGGAAVAAATGAGVFHLGSDGGGSIRIPAAFTGISGIKPTFGRVPAYPPSAFGTVAHLGPMARRTGDLEAMLAILSGRDRADWFQGEASLDALDPREISPVGKRIGIWRRPAAGDVASEVASQFENALARLEDAGAELIEFDLPMRDRLSEIFSWHWVSGARRRLDMLGDIDEKMLDQGLRAMAEEAREWSVSDYIGQVNLRADYGAAMDRALDDLDFLVSPAVAILPFGAGLEVPAGSGMRRWFEWAGFSYPINLSQQPAAVVPAGMGSASLPHSLQIVAARGRESSVMSLAKWWEARHPEYFL